MAINYNKVPVKYITGTFQYEESYPTTSDLLFEMLFGISMLVKLEQPSNASYPIVVTLFGISMLVKL